MTINAITNFLHAGDDEQEIDRLQELEIAEEAERSEIDSHINQEN